VRTVFVAREKAVVFLDRDGVINEDSSCYIRSVPEFRFIPGSAEAVARLCAAGFEVMLITNQSVIGRKLVTESTLSSIFEHMRQGLAAFGGTIKDIFYCPHRPEEHCLCRKPRPGLFFQAQAAHDVDLRSSIMVGDSAKDMEAALAAGVGTRVLVRTGNGKRDLLCLQEKGLDPDFVAKDLGEAVDWILLNREGRAVMTSKDGTDQRT